jgi:BirA family biotin operon repressor/biotin-[acetyl-CoA-carboxylase] ligase
LYKIPANTHLVGQHLVSVPECHSTNEVLQQWIDEKGLKDGLVVITDRQTRGRGQRGNSWESEAGKNLTFSVALHPHQLDAKDHFLMSMTVSLALSDYLQAKLDTGTTKIKWPNDILVNGKKICGILIENSIAGNRIQYSVVGIGLNVNQAYFAAPNATSMTLVGGGVYDLQETFDELLTNIERRYLQLRSGQYHELRVDYWSRLFGMGEERWFLSGDDSFAGVITGVDDAGRLVLRTGSVTKSFEFKEISYLF